VAIFGHDPSQTLIRDGRVQRYEFTYEISHEMLKRYLEQVSPSPAQYDRMPLQDLIRSANELGLLRGNWPAWKTYRDMRSQASHTDDDKVALEVVAGIPEFLQEAAYLLDQIYRRQARSAR
jgi:nucleotidyltransferase substrate binding protein (TIGR01987 family)